jgi:hypothetical protein
LYELLNHLIKHIELLLSTATAAIDVMRCLVGCEH